MGVIMKIVHLFFKFLVGITLILTFGMQSDLYSAAPSQGQKHGRSSSPTQSTPSTPKKRTRASSPGKAPSSPSSPAAPAFAPGTPSTPSTAFSGLRLGSPYSSPVLRSSFGPGTTSTSITALSGVGLSSPYSSPVLRSSFGPGTPPTLTQSSITNSPAMLSLPAPALPAARSAANTQSSLTPINLLSLFGSTSASSSSSAAAPTSSTLLASPSSRPRSGKKGSKGNLLRTPLRKKLTTQEQSPSKVTPKLFVNIINAIYRYDITDLLNHLFVINPNGSLGINYPSTNTPQELAAILASQTFIEATEKYVFSVLADSKDPSVAAREKLFTEQVNKSFKIAFFDTLPHEDTRQWIKQILDIIFHIIEIANPDVQHLVKITLAYYYHLLTTDFPLTVAPLYPSWILTYADPSKKDDLKNRILELINTQNLEHFVHMHDLASDLEEKRATPSIIVSKIIRHIHISLNQHAYTQALEQYKILNNFIGHLAINPKNITLLRILKKAFADQIDTHISHMCPLEFSHETTHMPLVKSEYEPMFCAFAKLDEHIEDFGKVKIRGSKLYDDADGKEEIKAPRRSPDLLKPIFVEWDHIQTVILDRGETAESDGLPGFKGGHFLPTFYTAKITAPTNISFKSGQYQIMNAMRLSDIKKADPLDPARRDEIALRMVPDRYFVSAVQITNVFPQTGLLEGVYTITDSSGHKKAPTTKGSTIFPQCFTERANVIHKLFLASAKPTQGFTIIQPPIPRDGTPTITPYETTIAFPHKMFCTQKGHCGCNPDKSIRIKIIYLKIQPEGMRYSYYRIESAFPIAPTHLNEEYEAPKAPAKK